MKLVLVHGFLGSSLNWGPVISKLKSSAVLQNLWSFHTVDLLGHAYRPLKEGRTEITLEEVALDLLDQLPFEEPFVALGHSFGLRPLLWIAGHKPERLRHLIVEDSSPEIKAPRLAFLKDILENTPAPFPNRDAARLFFDQKFGVGSALSRFLFSNIREQSSGLYTWRFAVEPLNKLLSSVAAQHQWAEWIHYPKSLTLIRGERSDFLDAKLAEEALAKRNNLDDQFIQIPNAGHWVHSENLDAFMDALIDRLNKLTSQTS